MDLSRIHQIVLETMREAVYIRDLDQNILYINPASEQLTGVSLGEAKKKKCYEVFGDVQVRCREVCPVEKAIAEGVHILHHEYSVESPSGESHHMQVSISPVFEGEMVAGAVIVMEDVTRLKEVEETRAKTVIALEAEMKRRRRVEEALREREEKYRSIFNNAAVGINLRSRDGIILEVNQPFINILGYSREELDNVSYLDITHPDDVELSRERRDALERGDLDTYRIEKRYLGKSGGAIWVDTSVTALRDSHGKVRATIGVLADITERKNAEEALRKSEEFNRRLVEHAPFGMAYLAKDGTIEYVNPAANRMMGIPEGQISPGLGLNILELPGIQGRPEIKEIFYRLMKGEAFSGVELPYRSLMGQDTVLFVSATPRFGTDGTVAGAILMFTDIAERKRAERLQRETVRFRAVADLAGGVAHNFNNLLQIVIGNLELALMDLESENYADVKDSLEKVLESSRFGAETVRRLQSFAGIRHHSQLLEKGVFDLSAIVRQALEMSKTWLQTIPEKEGIKVSLDAKLHDGCLVEGEKNELFEVAVTLIRNASEALPHGGAIDIKTGIKGNQIVLMVRDTGVGISKENLKRIFNPFFTTKANAGSGLGLASSRKIIEACGGEISVESTEGKGTTFTIILPLAKRAAQAVAPSAPVSGPRTTILVIDDMEAVLAVLKAGLTRSGHVVVTASSGQQGLDIFKENPIDLVICDLGMPGLNGWEVGKRIRSVCEERHVPKTPFILLTGWGGQKTEAEKISESGVDAVVEKPINIRNTLGIIREIVQGRPGQDSQ